MMIFLCNIKWAYRIGSSGEDSVSGMKETRDGNYFYVFGGFSGTNVDFNPADGVEDLHSSQGGKDYFISKYKKSGEYLWTRTFGNSEDQRCFTESESGC